MPTITIPGDAPALVEAFITPSGGAAPPIWAALGWWPKVGVWNHCWNGDFENALLGTNGWSVAAVTNLNNVATSITRITTAAKYGTCSGQIVCPSTAQSGATFRIFRRFKKGVTYTAEAWIHSAAGTTATRIVLGNAAASDLGVSGTTNLSTGWQRITITWTPTADRDDAHVAVQINAATATTFEIDGVMVYEGTVAPTSANQSEGRGGFPPVGILEAENGLIPGGNLTADATSRSGFHVTSTGGAGGLFVKNVIDPSLLTPDDYAAKTIAIEVWARMALVSTDANLITLRAEPLTSSVGMPYLYSEEFGSVGKVPVVPSSGTSKRFIRLGTLRLPTDGGRWLLTLAMGNSSSASTGLDYFLLLPAQARALSPSGRANDSTFPVFASVTTELTRRIRADLSGMLKEPTTGAPESQAPSLGGSLLEFPPGQIEYVVKLSNLVPDDPTSNTSSEQLSHSATVHLAVTPRWRLGRSS